MTSDGCFFNNRIEIVYLILDPAESAEILVDFSNFNDGDTIQLSNKGSEFMKFVVNGESESNYAIPEQLTTIEKIDPDEAVRTREFVFQGMGPMVNINGKQMDMNRIDEFVDI